MTTLSNPLKTGIVYLIEDDDSVRFSVTEFLCNANYQVFAYTSAKEFLDRQTDRQKTI